MSGREMIERDVERVAQLIARGVKALAVEKKMIDRD